MENCLSALDACHRLLFATLTIYLLTRGSIKFYYNYRSMNKLMFSDYAQHPFDFGRNLVYVTTNFIVCF